MAFIAVDRPDRSYRVVEDLGHQGGHRAKVVDYDGRERVAVKRGGKWVWWEPADRLGLPPLRTKRDA